MYEVIKTLLVDKQRDRKVYRADGTYYETKYTKPIGYVLEDTHTGDLFAVSRMEAILKISEKGCNNAIVSQTVKTDKKTGGKVPSFYIRSRADCKALQDSSMVMLFDKDLLIRKGVDISDRLIWVLKNYYRLKRDDLL